MIDYPQQFVFIAQMTKLLVAILLVAVATALANPVDSAANSPNSDTVQEAIAIADSGKSSSDGLKTLVQNWKDKKDKLNKQMLENGIHFLASVTPDWMWRLKFPASMTKKDYFLKVKSYAITATVLLGLVILALVFGPLVSVGRSLDWSAGQSFQSDQLIQLAEKVVHTIEKYSAKIDNNQLVQ